MSALQSRVVERIGDVEAFRRSLLAGPLEAIVRKQGVRLQAARDYLQAPYKPLPPDLVCSQHKCVLVGCSGTRLDRCLQNTDRDVLYCRPRPRVARITPFFGSALAKVAKVGGDSTRKEIRISRAPKPLYRWERRRSTSSSQRRPAKWIEAADCSERTSPAAIGWMEIMSKS